MSWSSPPPAKLSLFIVALTDADSGCGIALETDPGHSVTPIGFIICGFDVVPTMPWDWPLWSR